MKNSAGRGVCYPPRLKAKVDNALRALQNSSYPTKAKFSNCFIIHLKYFQTLNPLSPNSAIWHKMQLHALYSVNLLKGENELYF